MLYFDPIRPRIAAHAGGAKIADVLRHAWSRLARKQWLILYPFALAVIDTLAFLAVYASTEAPLAWSAFFNADFNRWQFVRDHFFAEFSFTSAVGVAAFAGLATCAFAAMIRAPFFRAIAGPRYPLGPQRWKDPARLFLLYLLVGLVQWVMPLALPAEGFIRELAYAVILVFGILVVFADYAIVFEDLPFLSALRRSVHLLARRWVTVLVIVIVVELVYLGVYSLYGIYYDGTGQVFALLPLSLKLVESFIVMFSDLVLIFLYEQLRRQRPA